MQAVSERVLGGLGPLDLEALLRGLPQATNDRHRDYNLSLVRRLGTPSCMADLLAGYLADEESLRRIADRSYRHVNHFDKIVLVDSGDPRGYRLTLHAWCPPYSEQELRDELIHDHRFSFWSTILTGRLTSENFARPREGDSADAPRGPVTAFRQYRYSPEKTGVSTQANFYRFVDEAALEMTGETVEERGNAYHLEYQRIHRVVLPRESMTCTLVLRGPRERDFSNVYNTSYPSTDTQSANVMFTVDELAGKLRRLRQALLAPGDGRPS
ncbi:hypothetical protein ACF1AE_27030 [Streptomyces sp. NPDC014986]|uniref:hypothetical protein n=1 Tax=Streptomyces sp. NPDC014986 TaxID=3364934 RepID=UPI003703415E